MIVQCEKCSTTYHLDQTLLEPFGSKVRCSRCDHIFWVEPTSQAETSRPVDSLSGPESFLPLDKEHQEEEEETEPFQVRPANKTLWGLGVLTALILLALIGRYVYIQYLHPQWGIKDLLSEVVFITPDPEGNQRISLIHIKKYFKENQKSGRFFVVEGEVKNGYSDIRQKIKIRGSLRTADNRVAVSREVYVGWTLSPEELETLSFDEINRLAASQPERFSAGSRIQPGKTLPFMILFPPLPPGSSQVSIEVVSSQRLQPNSSLRTPTG